MIDRITPSVGLIGAVNKGMSGEKSMDVIEENVKMLNNFNFDEVRLRLTFREIDGEIVQYMTVMFDKDSGKILDLSKGPKDYENMNSSPIAIKTKNLLETNFELELLDSLGPSKPNDPAREVVTQSFEKFNKEQVREPSE